MNISQADVVAALSKTSDWHGRRARHLGGSDAKVIMSGSEEALYQLWEEKRGLRAPDNLDDVLPVQMGSWTEPFGIYWFAKKTGLAVSREGDHAVSDDHPFMACTLDGWIAAENAILECKHCSGREPFETLIERYTPQVMHSMAVTGATKAYLSVLLGNGDWRSEIIPFDPFYAAALIAAEEIFWSAVITGNPPCAAPAVAVPMPEKMREVEMTSNSWVSNAADWLGNRKAAKICEAAAKDLKASVERDVARAFGAGIQITRARNGALTIKEFAQ